MKINKKKILFINFDSFNKEKKIFFNNLIQFLNEKNCKFEISSSVDIHGLKCKVNKLLLSRLESKIKNLNILNLINIKKKNIDEWTSVFKKFYKLSDNQIREKIYTLIKNIFIDIGKGNINLVILWTEYYPICQIYIKILKYYQIPYLIAERGFLKGTLMIEKNGIYGKSKITALTKKKIYKINNPNNKIFFNRYLKKYKNINKTWSQINDKNEIKILEKKINKRKIIFYAFTNQIWHGFFPLNNRKTNPYFKNEIDVVKLIRKKMDINKYFLVCKIHPKDRVINKNIINDKNVFITKNIDIDYLIKKCDKFLTLCSTVIFDAILKNKSSCILGNFYYSNKKVITEIKKISHLENFINNKNKKNNLKNFKSFINYSLSHFLYDITNKNLTKKNYIDFANFLLEHCKKKNNKLVREKFKKGELLLKNISINFNLKNITRLFFHD